MDKIENIHVPERLEGESFEDYKYRRFQSRFINKNNAKGRLIWDTPNLGQYIASEHLSDAMKKIVEESYEETTE